MSKQIKELNCKTLLVDVSEYPLNFLIFTHRLTANAYVGRIHDCAYCFARWYCKRDEIKVKIKAAEILKKELQNRIVGSNSIISTSSSIASPTDNISNIGVL